MLKTKYKIHKLVNIIFYGIFWLSGFLIGLGVKGGNLIEKIKIFIDSII